MAAPGAAFIPVPVMDRQVFRPELPHPRGDGFYIPVGGQRHYTLDGKPEDTLLRHDAAGQFHVQRGGGVRLFGGEIPHEPASV